MRTRAISEPPADGVNQPDPVLRGTTKVSWNERGDGESNEISGKEGWCPGAEGKH